MRMSPRLTKPLSDASQARLIQAGPGAPPTVAKCSGNDGVPLASPRRMCRVLRPGRRGGGRMMPGWRSLNAEQEVDDRPPGRSGSGRPRIGPAQLSEKDVEEAAVPPRRRTSAGAARRSSALPSDERGVDAALGCLRLRPPDGRRRGVDPGGRRAERRQGRTLSPVPQPRSRTDPEMTPCSGQSHRLPGCARTESPTVGVPALVSPIRIHMAGSIRFRATPWAGRGRVLGLRTDGRQCAATCVC